MPRKIRIRTHATAEDESEVKADLASYKNSIFKNMSDRVVQGIEEAIINGDPPTPCCENCHYWERNGNVNDVQVPMGVCLNDASSVNDIEQYTATSHCDFHEYRLAPGQQGGNDFPVTANEGDLYRLRGRHYVRANGAWVPMGNAEYTELNSGQTVTTGLSFPVNATVGSLHINRAGDLHTRRGDEWVPIRSMGDRFVEVSAPHSLRNPEVGDGRYCTGNGQAYVYTTEGWCKRQDTTQQLEMWCPPIENPSEIGLENQPRGQLSTTEEPVFSAFHAMWASLTSLMIDTPRPLLWLWLIPVVSFTFAGVLWILEQ